MMAIASKVDNTSLYCFHLYNVIICWHRGNCILQLISKISCADSDVCRKLIIILIRRSRDTEADAVPADKLEAAVED